MQFLLLLECMLSSNRILYLHCFKVGNRLLIYGVVLRALTMIVPPVVFEVMQFSGRTCNTEVEKLKVTSINTTVSYNLSFIIHVITHFSSTYLPVKSHADRIHEVTRAVY